MKVSSSDRRKHRDSDDDETTQKSPFSTPTKRRKKELHQNLAKAQQTESFVMKLFDRSLDLSKYTDKTPLYPICRAWIANQPRNLNIGIVKEPKQPVRENNGAELLAKLQRGDNIVITGLPAPLNLDIPDVKEFRSEREPNLAALDEALKKTKDEEDDDEEEDAAPDMEVLAESRRKILQEHKEEWKKIKQKHRKHSMSSDRRYQLNQLILSKLYRSA